MTTPAITLTIRASDRGQGRAVVIAETTLPDGRRVRIVMPATMAEVEQHPDRIMARVQAHVLKAAAKPRRKDPDAAA